MNKLYLDDCRKKLYELLHDQIKVDHVVVDLPYYKVVKDEFDNQWENEEEYLDWVMRMFSLISQGLLKPNGNVIVFCSRQMQHDINYIFKKLGYINQRTIIWARKRGFNTTRGKTLASGYEPIMWFTKCNIKNPIFNNIKIKPETKRKEYTEGILKDGITLSDVWMDIPALPHNSKEKVDHPTQKPIKLMERIISVFTKEQDTILDFCMGSGTTGLACKTLNRNFIGIEKDENYFNIAKNRINE